MIDTIIHLCSSITLIKKITFLLESLSIFWIIVSKHSINIISSILLLKNHMYCHVWCLNINVMNFKFNLHHFNSAQFWLRSCLNLTWTFCLNLIQMWLRCILVSLVHHHIKMHLISSCSNLIQMWFKFISVSSVHYHIKLHFIFLLRSCLDYSIKETQDWYVCIAL